MNAFARLLVNVTMAKRMDVDSIQIKPEQNPIDLHKLLKISTEAGFVAFSPIAFEKASLFEAYGRFGLFQKRSRHFNPAGAFRKIHTSI